MKHLTYALASALLLTIVPAVLADPIDDAQQTVETLDHTAPCTWFSYTLDPPAYRVRPECLPALPNGL
jgi:hypothetical protein